MDHEEAGLTARPILLPWVHQSFCSVRPAPATGVTVRRLIELAQQAGVRIEIKSRHSVAWKAPPSATAWFRNTSTCCCACVSSVGVYRPQRLS